MADTPNPDVNTWYLTVNKRLMVTDPNGKPLILEQGQQFKWTYKRPVPRTSTCSRCNKPVVYQYYIIGYAHCPDPAWNGVGILVHGKHLVETDILALPPVTTLWEDERAGKEINWEIPPESRPKEQTAWYWTGKTRP